MGRETWQAALLSEHSHELLFLEEGSCVNADPALFFAERGYTSTEGKAICNGCPVREPCLEYALKAREDYGVWGGLTRNERRELIRRRARRSPRAR